MRVPQRNRFAVLASIALALCLATLRVSPAPAAPPEHPDQTLRLTLKPFSTWRSPTLRLSTTQTLRLTLDPDSKLTVDIFIYEADTKELVGRSDDEAIEPYYEWQPLKDGRYYVVARNVASGAGSASLIVAPRDITKSTAQPEIPNYAQMNIYYATDRELTAQGNSGATYGTEPSRAGLLNFGIARVSIPRAHSMGELEAPTLLKLEFRQDPNQHVVLLSATPEDERAFFQQLGTRVAQSPHRDALVFVHGFNVNFEDATRRTAQIAYDLGFDGAAILYSWPSQGSLGLIDYEKDVRNPTLSATHLRTFLSDLAQKTGVRTLHVIAHSMGNQVLVKALTQQTASQPAAQTLKIQHLALMAPDMDAAEFRQLAPTLKAAVDDVTLYASSGDSALKASETLIGYPRAGLGGKDIVVMPGVLETIDCSAVDTSFLGVGHTYYADSSAILSDLFQLLHGSPARDRFGLKPTRNADGAYWIFSPAAR